MTKVGLNVNGALALLYSSRIGGSGADQAYGVATDGSGNVYLTGNTNSSNFPIMPLGGIPGACNTGCGNGSTVDAFVTKTGC